MIRAERDRRVVDVMSWDVLGGQASWPMTNVRNLKLPQWRALATDRERRCLVPLTEFCEWTPDQHEVGDGPPVKGEMWFAVTDEPVFAIGGFWQITERGPSFAMVTCNPNELVAPIPPKAMITIVAPEDQDRWLNGSLEDVIELQRPFPAERMIVRGPVFPTRKAGTGRVQSTASVDHAEEN